MLKSMVLVDDETLFHLVVEDACSSMNVTDSLQNIYSTDEAEAFFRDLKGGVKEKPECVLVDLNLIGSPIDGIELIRRINHVYSLEVVVGMISSSRDQTEQNRAKNAGAQFWIVKTDEIEPRLEKFRNDYSGYAEKTAPFTIYN